jgi:ABC-type branched-subunit amino acid transport system substrate-binding protein
LQGRTTYGVHGIVGERDNPISKSIALVCSDYNNVAQVSYGSNAAELRNRAAYPNTVGVFPSNAYEAYVLADLIGKTWAWSRVALVYTTNIYGKMLLLQPSTFHIR